MTTAAISMVVGCLGAGEPINQTGVNNAASPMFGTDGVSNGAPPPTPAHWTSEFPSPGVAYRYYIKITDTGLNHGSAAALTGAAVAGFVNMGGTIAVSISGGLGGRNFSYQISGKSDGSNVVATGTGTISNDF